MWRFRLFIVLALSGLLVGPGPPGRSAARGPRVVIQGVTISTHTDGRDWASERMGETLERIRSLGAGWVAIHPYARIDGDGSVSFRPIDPRNPPEHIAGPIRRAHAAGLRILIKPHLAYWRSPFAWRGEITFETDEQWRRFWKDYEHWIVQLAAATPEADGFVVGTELDRTLDHVESWERLISRVRKRTRAPLTYAANWTDFERVPFWKSLDWIGIQAYFPVSEQADPGDDALREGWKRLTKRLRGFSKRNRRPIVLTELGYNRSFNAPVRPWDPHTDGPESERVQRACMLAALQAIDAEPTILGSFLWKWFPEPHPVGRDFQLATPGMIETIRHVWR